jgi:hypothetical protein
VRAASAAKAVSVSRNNRFGGDGNEMNPCAA